MITIEFTPVMMGLVASIAALLQGFKALIAESGYAKKISPFLPIGAVAVGIGLCALTKQADPMTSGLFVGMAASFGFDLFKGIGPKK